MIDLARHSMCSDYLFHHRVPFFIYGVELGAMLTIIILLAGTLSLQVNGIYVLSLYAEMFKVAIFIIEVDCWFILLPRSACRMTQDSDKNNTTHRCWTTVHESPHTFPLLNWSRRVNGTLGSTFRHQ